VLLSFPIAQTAGAAESLQQGLFYVHVRTVKQCWNWCGFTFAGLRKLLRSVCILKKPVAKPQTKRNIA